MTHKLTKFQSKVWNIIKHHLKDEYETQITFDDELQINFGVEDGKVSIEVFPKDEVLLLIKFDNGGFEKHFFNSNNLNTLITILEKNEYQ